VGDALASSKRSGKSTGLLLASYAATYALRRTRMLIRLIHFPPMKIGRERSSLGLVVAQLSCLWLALASLALFEPIAVAVHFEDVDVVGQPVE
jgi:hypothetical protein